MSVPWRPLLEKKSGDSPQVSDSGEFFTDFVLCKFHEDFISGEA